MRFLFGLLVGALFILPITNRRPLFILPDIIRRPLFISPEFNSGYVVHYAECHSA